ncbi:MAG: serine/threonine protein kinase [Deltaproteobacteria bacterium]|nr:serine/threonine protein kinase [Deltaproteobacteria bacterium]
MDTSTSPSFTSPEAKAFYQSRVASFGLSIAAAGAIGLGFRMVIGLASGTFLEKLGEPGYWLHAAAIVPCLAMWLVCRGGPRQLATVIGVETMGLLFASVGYIGMGMTIPPEVGADVITAFALSFALFSRAVLVPSTARHTAWLGLIIGVPLVGMMALHYRDVDPAMWRMVGYDTRGFERSTIIISTALMTTMWWTLTVGLSSIASYVIHRLRSEVSSIRSLGQYQLEHKLGEGAMGVVYQATHGMLKRPTAVKLLRPELGGREVHDLFRREVQLTATLKHPHTIRIYDYGRTPEGLFYYAMELLDGASLQDIVDATGPQPAPRVVRILRDVAHALDEAHSVGLIHRDVKPGNIMLARQGGSYVVKVLDFGLVKRLSDEDAPGRHDTRSIQGTPHYLSPEGVNTPNEVDARSDLYSLGAVGYYLLTGRPVFEGDTVYDVCMQHVQAAPPPMSEARGEPVPKQLEQLILSCLAKHKDDRPASAQAFADALDQLDLPRWTRADAEEWWQRHGHLVEEERDSIVPRITGHTMNPVIDEPWFEGADTAPRKP